MCDLIWIEWFVLRSDFPDRIIELPIYCFDTSDRIVRDHGRKWDPLHGEGEQDRTNNYAMKYTCYRSINLHP